MHSRALHVSALGAVLIDTGSFYCKGKRSAARTPFGKLERLDTCMSVTIVILFINTYILFINTFYVIKNPLKQRYHPATLATFFLTSH